MACIGAEFAQAVDNEQLEVAERIIYLDGRWNFTELSSSKLIAAARRVAGADDGGRPSAAEITSREAYYLCHGGSDPRLNWWLMSNAAMTLASAAVPRTRFSNGIFCNIAALQITHSNSNICFNMAASQELEVTVNFPLLRFFGHSSSEAQRPATGVRYPPRRFDEPTTLYFR